MKWNKKQTCTRPKSNMKPHSLATTNKPPRAVQIQLYNKEGGKPSHPSEQKCVLCSDRHCVALCPVFKSKTLKEKKQVVQEHELCFNWLRANHQSKECPITNRCIGNDLITLSCMKIVNATHIVTVQPTAKALTFSHQPFERRILSRR